MLNLGEIKVNPLISIITPCYNAAHYLRAAAESVLSQTYQNFEWILVNDGSTDETDLVIREYEDGRIRYFKQDNMGQCAASNFGLKKARGAYIKFFDADDLMNPEHLQLQFNSLNGFKDAISSCSWGRFYDGNPQSAQFIPETVWENLDSLLWIKKALSQKYDMMGVWLWLIPKSVIEKTGGWDESLSLNNDFEFSIRLLLAVKEVRFAPDARIYYRSGNTSLSQQHSEKSYRAAIKSTDLGCINLLQRENTREIRQLCANRYQEWLFRMYPDFPTLQSCLEVKIAELGGSTRKIDGGIIFRYISMAVGWKIAKRIKLIFLQIGYKKLPFN